MKKKLFYFGLLCLVLFEILNVYFIMPMPGSQDLDSIDLAYFLYSWRWKFRVIFFLMIAIGFVHAFKTRRKWVPILLLLIASAIAWLFNFKMVADEMFLQPQNFVLKNSKENKVPVDRIIIGVENNGKARAYPISFMAYHHHVEDNIGGKFFMITYCSVCRSGRVYEPVVEGRRARFRLVGMNHFNAMFEDNATCSWWRQENGEAVEGPMKGQFLPEAECVQMSIDKWLQLHPDGEIMQADEASIMHYDTLARFEQGKSQSSLTYTDSSSWNAKSWVVGICIGKVCKAYDWNDLKKLHVINDSLNGKKIVLVLSSDEKSFASFESPGPENFIVMNDTIFSNTAIYNFNGKDFNSDFRLKPVSAYQEFWHSWRTFHPHTFQYSSKPDSLK